MGCGVLIAVLLCAKAVSAQGTAFASPAYSLDGIVLGSNIEDLIRTKGMPQSAISGDDMWRNAAGGTLDAHFEPDGAITRIDVKAGQREVRTIQMPGITPNWTSTLGETVHMNYDDPPGATYDDLFCGYYRGEPCESFKLPGDTELIVNFGKDIGLADWLLSEVVLGNRSAMLKSLSSP